MSDQFLWVEKYRPKTIDECILPDNLKTTFKEFISSGQLPNFLFCGTAGVGKTTIAKALCNEIGAEYLLINGSEESGIDVLRTKIKSFASTVSLTDAKKVVILDEADYLNANSTQPALRGFIEEFSGNCRFIFTCNFKNRIIEPLHSRCAVVEFKIDGKDKKQVKHKVEFLNRKYGGADSERVVGEGETEDKGRSRYDMGARVESVLPDDSEVDKSSSSSTGLENSKPFEYKRTGVVFVPGRGAIERIQIGRMD
jgi:replication-associated recombination protein RarA